MREKNAGTTENASVAVDSEHQSSDEDEQRLAGRVSFERQEVENSNRIMAARHRVTRRPLVSRLVSHARIEKPVVKGRCDTKD